MKPEDKQRVKRIINNTNDVIKYSGLAYFSGKMDSRYDHFSKDLKSKALVLSAVLDLTNIAFDSDKFDVDSYLRVRLVQLQQRFEGQIWKEVSADQREIDSNNLFSKDFYAYKIFVAEAGITDADYRNLISTLTKYALSKVK